MKCTKCGVTKDISHFHRKGTRHEKSCKECEAENYRLYREANKATIAAKRKQFREEHREEINTKKRKQHKIRAKRLFLQAIEGYGGKCKNCDEDRPLALLFHHPNGDGVNHRKETGSGFAMYYWLISNNFPSTVELLCGTCHLILHREEELI